MGVADLKGPRYAACFVEIGARFDHSKVKTMPSSSKSGIRCKAQSKGTELDSVFVQIIDN
jgi:hypothetical protein